MSSLAQEPVVGRSRRWAIVALTVVALAIGLDYAGDLLESSDDTWVSEADDVEGRLDDMYVENIDVIRVIRKTAIGSLSPRRVETVLVDGRVVDCQVSKGDPVSLDCLDQTPDLTPEENS